MIPPVPQTNNFFKNTRKPIVEPISKFFIVAAVILGVNRIPIIITKTFIKLLVLCYSAFINLLYIFLILSHFTGSLFGRFLATTDSLQFAICSILGFVLHKRLLNFYTNLNQFDKDIGINAKTFSVRESIYNLSQLFITLLTSLTMFGLGGHLFLHYRMPHLMLMKLMASLELHYYGHLISLMIARLKIMNNFMRLWYPNNKKKVKFIALQEQDKNSYLNMKRLMDLYNEIITAYDCLNEAIKWQILIYLTTTFVLTLSGLYFIIKFIISNGIPARSVILLNLSLLLIELLPLLVPCILADRVQREVCLIKDLVDNKLYENTLDKPSRRTARTLLALIETRNLSFPLFHMFYIDISLPFKFLALLLTYLIIVLQFDKVVSN